MSPKKKTKLHRNRKSRANKANLKKQIAQKRAVTDLLEKLEQEDQSK
ncbi:MAG: hypothetical protein HQM13_18580 [SAR324 cluster bacterium]|nr:hypothetical protein [SAR324 cluster bacterium]